MLKYSHTVKTLYNLFIFIDINIINKEIQILTANTATYKKSVSKIKPLSHCR
jgi:hypothetical protein